MAQSLHAMRHRRNEVLAGQFGVRPRLKGPGLWRALRPRAKLTQAFVSPSGWQLRIRFVSVRLIVDLLKRTPVSGCLGLAIQSTFLNLKFSELVKGGGLSIK